MAIMLGMISADEVLTGDHMFLQSVSDIEKAQQAKEFVSEKSEDLTRVNCLLYSDMTFFDLRALESEKPYQIGKHYFQFCRRLKADDTKTFAYFESGSLWTS